VESPRADHVEAATLPGLTLFEALQAVFQEHPYCGELDGGVEGDRVSITCTYRAIIKQDADRD